MRRIPAAGRLVRLRSELAQYINLGPVRAYPGVSLPVVRVQPEDVDMVFVRENSEGLYVGAGGFSRRGTGQEVATQESLNTRAGVDRCLRYAFELAREPGRRRRVTLAHKTNVLNYARDPWSRAVAQ